MSTSVQLSEAFRQTAQAQIDHLMAELPSLQAIVIATADGFDLLSVVKPGVEPARIAAMASSIAAISTVVSQEAQLGRNRSVTIDTEAGFAVVYSVHRPEAELVINIIAGADVLVGEVAYRAGHLAKALSQA